MQGSIVQCVKIEPSLTLVFSDIRDRLCSRLVPWTGKHMNVNTLRSVIYLSLVLRERAQDH